MRRNKEVIEKSNRGVDTNTLESYIIVGVPKHRPSDDNSEYRQVGTYNISPTNAIGYLVDAIECLIEDIQEEMNDKNVGKLLSQSVMDYMQHRLAHMLEYEEEDEPEEEDGNLGNLNGLLEQMLDILRELNKEDK